MTNYKPKNLLRTTEDLSDSSLWKERYLPDLQMAGDSALSSIDKGLSYAKDFMADANPGTDPDKIRTAAVKWALATDTNDERLKKQADFELMDSLAPGSVGTNAIGTPSLSEYIRKKDEYDYKTGRYTTTENASKTPDTQTRELQTPLNRGGYTDRFGNTLKEDGILGAKTAQALQKASATTLPLLLEDRPAKIKKLNEMPEGKPQLYAAKTTSNPANRSNKQDSTISSLNYGSDGKGGLNKVAGRLEAQLRDLHLIDRVTGDKGSEIDKKQEAYSFARETMDELSSFNTSNITRLIVLNNTYGAEGAGHTATLLINQDEQAILFSYYPANQGILDEGQARIAVLDHDEWYSLLYDENPDFTYLITTTGEKEGEKFDRHLYLEISASDGKNALNMMEDIFNHPGRYNLASNNCDHITAEIVTAAGKYYNKELLPNTSFLDTTLYHTNRSAWIAEKAVESSGIVGSLMNEIPNFKFENLFK